MCVSTWRLHTKNSVITCGCAMGISFAVSLAQAKWAGKDLQSAVTMALKQSISIGLGTLVISFASQQLLRTSAAQIGKVASRYAVHGIYQTALGKTAIEKLAAFSLQKTVYGAAAVNHVSKLLRSNVITGVVTTAVLTAPDLYRAAISGKASWKQLSKNLAVNAASVAGGAGGWAAGAAAGAAIGSVVPGVGTAIGGIVGSIFGALAGGTVAGMAAKSIADQITPDDSEEMLKLCNKVASDLACDYLLSEQEMDIFVDKLTETIDLDFLRDMYGAGESNKAHRKWAKKRFKPLVKAIVQERQQVTLPEPEELAVLIAGSLEQLEQAAGAA